MNYKATALLSVRKCKLEWLKNSRNYGYECKYVELKTTSLGAVKESSINHVILERRGRFGNNHEISQGGEYFFLD